MAVVRPEKMTTALRTSLMVVWTLMVDIDHSTKVADIKDLGLAWGARDQGTCDGNEWPHSCQSLRLREAPVVSH